MEVQITASVKIERFEAHALSTITIYLITKYKPSFLFILSLVTLKGLEVTFPVKPELNSIAMISSHLFLCMTSAFSSQYTGFPSFVLYTEPRSMLTTRLLPSLCSVFTSSSTRPTGFKMKENSVKTRGDVRHSKPHRYNNNQQS